MSTVLAQPIRTLLVEDDRERTDSIRANLVSTLGPPFAIEHRRTLNSAVSRARVGNLDVVLLDLELPDSSGIDSVLQLRAAAPELPIVVVTESDDEDLAIRTLQARAENYLVKSRTDLGVLKRAIHHALERHGAQVELEANLRALERSEAGFRALVASSRDGMLVVARDGRILFANPSAARLLERPLDGLRPELVGYPFEPRERHEITIDSGRVLEVHVVESDWDGATVWLASLFDITHHKLSNATLEDAKARMQLANLRLERLASIDPLTELLNRRGLDVELATEVRRKRRSGSPLAAVLLDCDDFKQINEAIGHTGGDVVLKQLADRLKESLRPTDHIGRIGGDEFLILLPDTRFGEAFQVAERLRLSVSDQPWESKLGNLRVTASLGIELVPDGSASIDEVVASTQRSLQHSKHRGKNRVSTQDANAARSATDSKDVVRELQSHAAFRVLRQPIFALSDASVVGWEMFPRGPAGVFEMPRDFFRLALEHDILTQIDLHCLEACAEYARRLPGPARRHVNVLPSTLLETSPKRLYELLAPPAESLQFCVELSEQHVVGDPSMLRERVRSLKDAGISVALDNVGFGRSSLEALILLEPNSIKIDPTFVRSISRDAGKERSLRRLVGMVQSLGTELIAEGVGSIEDLQLLREIGVRYGQGTLWGLPA